MKKVKDSAKKVEPKGKSKAPAKDVKSKGKESKKTETLKKLKKTEASLRSVGRYFDADLVLVTMRKIAQIHDENEDVLEPSDEELYELEGEDEFDHDEEDVGDYDEDFWSDMDSDVNAEHLSDEDLDLSSFDDVDALNDSWEDDDFESRNLKSLTTKPLLLALLKERFGGRLPSFEELEAEFPEVMHELDLSGDGLSEVREILEAW